MMVMVANASGFLVGATAQEFPGRLGHLFSPGAQRGPWEIMPYALDNGAWPAHINGEPWSVDAWRDLLLWSAKSAQRPLWAVVPDVVADREGTLDAWNRFHGEVRKRGFRPAFAVQDGMTFDDVPSDDCVLCIGRRGRVQGRGYRPLVRQVSRPRARPTREQLGPPGAFVARRRGVGRRLGLVPPGPALQPARRPGEVPTGDDVTTYPVSKIFRTLQGEGHFVGYPAVFIRLAGCSVLGCSIRSECDEAPWKAAETLTSVEVAARAAFFNPGGIAVITGGEPTDHDLIPLVCGLKDMGMRVHLETSGVRSVDGYPLDWITVSPKLPGYAQRSGHALKVVVRPSWTWKQVAALDEGTTFFHRYLQPLTMSDGSSNLAEVVALLDQVQGSRWALSVQAHKQWGLP